MRSKVTASYQLMVIIDRFDLISQPLRAASFPSRGSLTHRHFGVWNSSGRGMPPPLQRFAGRHTGSRYTTPPPSPSVTPPPARREAALRRKCVPPSLKTRPPGFPEGRVLFSCSFSSQSVYFVSHLALRTRPTKKLVRHTQSMIMAIHTPIAPSCIFTQRI